MRPLGKLAEAGRLLTAMLAGLPESARQQLTDESNVLPISRFVQVLAQDTNKLVTLDLAKMASAFEPHTAPRHAASADKKGHSDRGRPNSPHPEAASTSDEPETLAEALRMVYGLDWPRGKAVGPKSEPVNSPPLAKPAAKTDDTI